MFPFADAVKLASGFCARRELAMAQRTASSVSSIGIARALPSAVPVDLPADFIGQRMQYLRRGGAYKAVPDALVGPTES